MTVGYELCQIKNAYDRLKSYIFYDNTDILLRRQLVEFETNKTKDINSLFGKSPRPYELIDEFTIGKKIPVEEKLRVLTDMLNLYHSEKKAQDFFSYLFNQISVSLYPKKFKTEDNLPGNLITNEKVLSKYPIERLTAFIFAPIELHILSALWIIEEGVSLDANFSKSCLGNRLLLTKEKNKLVQGSGLFKPYFKQYQNWRDESVKIAKQILDDEKNALFINLDIKDYFHSVRLSVDEICPECQNSVNSINHYYNLRRILLKIHLDYTTMVSKKYKVPNDFYDEIEKDENGQLKKVILPIGFLSSYVLANKYLQNLDNKILEEVKPAYYGRYVDDILIVVSQSDNRFQSIAKNEKSSKRITEKLILDSFGNIFEIQEREDQSLLKLKDYDALYCQSEKSLLYYFKHDESSLVIDKLKKELDERTSEFRDMPIEDGSNDAFETSAYHLLYDGTEGKIRTLKDYKENRYGLSIFLTNKIFSSLSQDANLEEKEIKKILNFFRGINCLEYYRLWEKIFTLFLVNNSPKEYVEFYIHCIEQIDNVINNNITIPETDFNHQEVNDTLVNYLDCAHELSLSLNPNFISSTKEVSRNFEFKINELGMSTRTMFFSNFEPTEPNSFWVSRFRESNFIRHQYIIQPLLNYTKKAKLGWCNLLSLSTEYKDYDLDDEMLNESPRPLKFGECCLAYSYSRLSKLSKNELKSTDVVLGINPGVEDEFNLKEGDHIYLNEVFELYRKVNKKHLADYLLEDSELINNYFQSTIKVKESTQLLKIHELKVLNNKKKINKPKIAFANTNVEENNVIASLRGKPNLSPDRYKKLATILNKARKEDADIILFPEFFIPINQLSILVRFARKNQSLIVSGLEHISCNGCAYNFIVTIIPIQVNGINDAILLFRLKNHYAPHEELLIIGNHLDLPKKICNRYDIINWNNIYISPYYCFELADVYHRSLFKGKIDMMIGVEWNKDTPYFSNIVEATSRDLHAYFAQVNTSQFGDSRLTQPSSTAKKDLLRLKGGINDAILVTQIDLPKLREFQQQKYVLSRDSDDFKPLPPDYLLKDVLNRMNNSSVI